MADVLRTYETLGEGVQVLATHPGRIKDRLVAAFHHSLHAVSPSALSVPGMNREARAYWDKVLAAVTAAPRDSRRGVFEPSIEAEASHLAQLIVSVDSLVRYYLEHAKGDAR